MDRESYILFLFRCQRHTGKPLQLYYRPCHGGMYIPEIELNHLCTGHISGIF